MPQLDYDVIIIGSGPAGSTTARFAANAGLRVLLVDKRQELGAPIQCSGAISRHALEQVGIVPDAEFIHEAIYGFAIYDESGNRTVHDYRQLKADEYGVEAGKKPLGYVVDRRRFDRYLMTRAERAGVDVWLKTEGLGYTPHPDGHCTVRLQRYNEIKDLTARIVVGADGLQSQVGKWAGLQTHIKITELAGCLQFIVDGVETEGLLEIITGHRWAPGGYAWVFPKGHGYAEIGLGVVATMTDEPARDHLHRFISESFFADRFKNSRILEVQGGGVPLAAPLRTQFADNMILVGDAARHVNPITGGGLHTAVAGGKIAANFLVGHIGDKLPLTDGALKAYQDLWLAELGNKMWKLYDIKTDIFHNMNIPERDDQLYATMSDYFSPTSEFKKI
ncbi:2,3-di-O-geranylgeranylglyceryl phosphate reductase [Neolewinella xylanilytica]|uniref:2,3-di-O-geranylgeranylglyceryl phosphate reductase n=1 Tax=Neolewinella xylanilytica TaxID=1514080 RepID=A0A2S6I6D5_9BACT|nr:NAD(P)/FAD-dependent oxidoreductase [Neolewinella xylanilytica]PPK86713.1 2,3-di-O-geranylgeranylglyceryl phosphate reductase [Neolewinella xylanilytica]